MDPEAARTGHFDRLRMNGPGIAIEHQIGDALVVEDLGQGCGPSFGVAQKRQIARAVTPEDLIPGIEPHAPDIRTGPAQHLPEFIEKRSMRSLKKQERTLLAGQTCHAGVSCLCAQSCFDTAIIRQK